MTIDEAIEILTNPFPYLLTRPKGTYNQALKLGIEALKRCKVLAENNPLWAAKPLPGETEKIE